MAGTIYIANPSSMTIILWSSIISIHFILNFNFNIMAYKKRGTSPEYDKAQNRLAGIKQFETKIDFGNGLTEEAYLASMKLVDDLTKKNNDLLTSVDGVATELDQAEKDLAELSSRFLNAVGSKYTYDSVEYEKAGGTRTSEIKKTKKTVNTQSTK
jgi:hypothetical protein